MNSSTLIKYFILILGISSCSNYCEQPSITFGHIIDERDSNYYRIVTLYEPIEKGGKPIETTWFIENLRYQKTKPEFFYKRENFGCEYDYFPEYPDSICPNGWHIPTEEDWSILFKQIGLFPSDTTNWEDTLFGHQPTVLYKDLDTLKHPIANVLSDRNLSRQGSIYGWIGGKKEMLFYVLAARGERPTDILFVNKKVYESEMTEIGSDHLQRSGYCRCVKDK